jgi:hypothetical protein
MEGIIQPGADPGNSILPNNFVGNFIGNFVKSTLPVTRPFQARTALEMLPNSLPAK